MEEERVSILQVLLDVAAIENYALIQTEMERPFTVLQNVHVRRRKRKGLRVVVTEQSIKLLRKKVSGMQQLRRNNGSYSAHKQV
jgi:hypothetical protein